MFGRDRPSAETRSEPLLLLRPGVAPARRLSLVSPPPDNDRPVGSDQRRRPLGPVVSLLLHLLPLLLLLNLPTPKPAEVTPIPVQLVFQPPPPPPPPPRPAPKPKLKPETKPPPGRIASENLGETQTKGRDQAKSDEPPAKKQPAAPPEPTLEAPQQTAFLPPPPPLADPPKLDLPAPPPRKPAPAIHAPVRPRPERAHLNPRPARFPGPAATRDEYLAYLAYLARQHIGMLRGMIDGRRGETIINVLVLDDGTVAMLSVGLSSGFPDIDERVEAMIRAVGRFPPLPQWYQEPAMRLEFRLRFPEALDD